MPEFVRNQAKLWCFHKRDYSCEVPPVCTAHWSIVDWIKWITYHGRFNKLDHWIRVSNQQSI